MAAVTICSDFGAWEIKSVTVSIVFLFSIKWWDQMPWSSFFECWVLSQLFRSPFTFKRLFSSSSLSAMRMVSSAYLRLLIFLLAIFILACASSSPAFHMKYPAYKLNKQGDNTQPWCTPFLIWNQSVGPCPVLIIAFWPAYRFLKRQDRWSDIPISLGIFQSFLWSTQSNPAYLTYMQSTSWETLGWMKHKLESRLPQICRWYHPYGRKWRRTKEPLDESERGEWKTWLKAQHSDN